MTTHFPELSLGKEIEIGPAQDGRPALRETAMISVIHSDPSSFPELREVYADIESMRSEWSVNFDFQNDRLFLKTHRNDGMIVYDSDATRALLVSLYESFCHSGLLEVCVVFEDEDDQELIMSTIVPFNNIFYVDDQMIAAELKLWLERN